MTSKADAAKLAANERREGWETIMSTPASRRAVWELFEQLGIYQVAPETDHGTLAFWEGRRSVSLQVYHNLLAQCPELHDRMFIENRARIRLESKTNEDVQENDQ